VFEGDSGVIAPHNILGMGCNVAADKFMPVRAACHTPRPVADFLAPLWMRMSAARVVLRHKNNVVLKIRLISLLTPSSTRRATVQAVRGYEAQRLRIACL